MIIHDAIRYTRIPPTHGSGALLAVGSGTLIPDPLVTRQAVKTALEVGFRHFDCADCYRNEDAVSNTMQEVFKVGAIKRLNLKCENGELQMALEGNGRKMEGGQERRKVACKLVEEAEIQKGAYAGRGQSKRETPVEPSGGFYDKNSLTPGDYAA